MERCEEIISPLIIGSIKLANYTFLAPMAGITDVPFRIVCLHGGAGVVCAEMVSARALGYGSERSKRMLTVDPAEHPVSIQVFGDNPDAIAEAAKMAELAGADIVDINAGCPVKKINKAGAGCVLIKDMPKLAAMVSAAVKAVKVPVTLKTRIGLSKNNFKGAELARMAEDAGASALVIHGRYAEDMHAGPAHLDKIAETAAAVKIPVIGNGGITDKASADAMLAAGCKGIMIGRAAVGNPYIFSEILGIDKGQKKHKLEIYLDIIKENVKIYGEHTGVMRSRKTVGYWIKDFPDAAKVRVEFLSLTKAEDIEKLFLPLIKNYENSNG
ncbi:putative TIM-barrel protein [Parelusimicrobium proximum]|uniref:tRNA dihydrouridine synthase DusB n=1 Tax=Parelusimicrobium proximum TaxID=3228953 RepID=UPI003D17069E